MVVIYEVRCPRCDVSFPAGTRVCLHCGGKTGESSVAPVLSSEPRVVGRAEDEPLAAGENGLAEVPAGAEAESVRRSLFGTIMSLFWVTLLIAGYLFRSCGC